MLRQIIYFQNLKFSQIFFARIFRYPVFIKETTAQKKAAEWLTNAQSVLVDGRGKKKSFGWWSAEELVDWFQYNLTCFTASSLKQAFASEIDEVRLAKCLGWCPSHWLLIHHCLQSLSTVPWQQNRATPQDSTTFPATQVHWRQAPVSLLSALNTPEVAASV